MAAMTEAGVGVVVLVLSVENRVPANAGAIDALVAVMRAHVGGDAGVMEQACEAMGSICLCKGAWSWRGACKQDSADEVSITASTRKCIGDVSTPCCRCC